MARLAFVLRNLTGSAATHVGDPRRANAAAGHYRGRSGHGCYHKCIEGGGRGLSKGASSSCESSDVNVGAVVERSGSLDAQETRRHGDLGGDMHSGHRISNEAQSSAVRRAGGEMAGRGTERHVAAVAPLRIPIRRTPRLCPDLIT